MGLRVILEENVFVPVVICDRCKHRIEKASDGNYMWDASSDETSLIMYEHKRCHQAGGFLTGELSWLPIYLGNSLRMDWEKTREDIGHLDQI